ncbi:hypothetical protein ACA910_018520 [Epithemia clementina (nom. ined.)]
MERDKTFSRTKTSKVDHVEDRSTTVPVEHTTSRIINCTKIDDVSTSPSDASLDSVLSEITNYGTTDVAGAIPVMDFTTPNKVDNNPVEGRHAALSSGMSYRKHRRKSLVDDELLPFDEDEESYAGSYHSNKDECHRNSINVMSLISNMFVCNNGIDLSMNANTNAKPNSSEEDNDVTVHNLEEMVNSLQRQLDHCHRSLWHHKSDGETLREKILFLEKGAPNNTASMENVKAAPKKKISMNDCTEYANQLMCKLESYRSNGTSNLTLFGCAINWQEHYATRRLFRGIYSIR